ncbi:MAG TPA: ZIP family metal transporter [Clostridiales bacterium]|nr:ZIP family metal transporter [Clostridiales bacterium]
MILLNGFVTCIIVGVSAGIIGTGIGGAFAFILRQPSQRILSMLMGFSSGLMLSVVCFDLLPTAFEIGSLSSGITGIIIGVVLIIICEDIINVQSSHTVVGQQSSHIIVRQRDSYMRSGILVGIGIALHNFPEGLAIGSGLTVAQSYGLGLSILIAIHDIPEGMAMAIPLVAAGLSSMRVFLYTVLAGVPTGIGAIIGYMIGDISPMLISVCLGFAGGAMIYITCGEIIPEASNMHIGRISSIGTVLGIIAGILLTNIIN